MKIVTKNSESIHPPILIGDKIIKMGDENAEVFLWLESVHKVGHLAESNFTVQPNIPYT